MKTLFQCKNLSKYFGGVKAVHDVSLDIHADEILGVIGPNGAGKTTLFNVMTGYYPLTTGELFMEGMDIIGKPVHEMCSMGISRTFQNIRLFGAMTVIENIVVGMHTKYKCGFFEIVLNTASKKKKEKSVYDKSYEILTYLGIENKAESLAENLPYGIQRKVEIARALANEPKILLLDEPSAGMNPQETYELMELIRGIKERGPAVVVIEHNMQLIMGISDRIAVLSFGEKICDGPPDFVQNDECVIEAYLGEGED